MTNLSWHLATLGATFCVVLAPAIAQDVAPLEFKGIRIGEKLNQDQATARRMMCRPTECLYLLSERVKSNRDDLETIAGSNVQAMTVKIGDDGLVDRLEISAGTVAFDDVKAAFAAKYSPLKCDNTKVQSRLGATMDQSVCTFDTPAGRLRLVRRINVDTMVVVMESRRSIERRASEKESKKSDI
jgi:hypothetical protein